MKLSPTNHEVDEVTVADAAVVENHVCFREHRIYVIGNAAPRPATATTISAGDGFPRLRRRRSRRDRFDSWTALEVPRRRKTTSFVKYDAVFAGDGLRPPACTRLRLRTLRPRRRSCSHNVAAPGPVLRCVLGHGRELGVLDASSRLQASLERRVHRRRQPLVDVEDHHQGHVVTGKRSFGSHEPRFASMAALNAPSKTSSGMAASFSASSMSSGAI